MRERYLALVLNEEDSREEPWGLIREVRDQRGYWVERFSVERGWVRDSQLVRYTVGGETGAEEIPETLAQRIVKRWSGTDVERASRSRVASGAGASAGSRRATKSKGSRKKASAKSKKAAAPRKAASKKGTATKQAAAKRGKAAKKKVPKRAGAAKKSVAKKGALAKSKGTKRSRARR